MRRPRRDLREWTSNNTTGESIEKLDHDQAQPHKESGLYQMEDDPLRELKAGLQYHLVWDWIQGVQYQSICGEHISIRKPCKQDKRRDTAKIAPVWDINFIQISQISVLSAAMRRAEPTTHLTRPMAAKICAEWLNRDVRRSHCDVDGFVSVKIIL